MSLVGTRPPTLDEWEKARTYILLMNILYVGFISLAPDVIHIAGTKEYYHGISMIIPLSYWYYGYRN